MDLQKLNKETTFKELINLKSLDINRKYKIVKLRFSKTKFGDSLLAEMEDFVVYLPQRVFKYFEKDGVEDFNNAAKIRAVYLVSKGPIGLTNDVAFVQD